MCKGVPVCTELGADPTAWSRRSPLWPKAWFPESAEAFRAAYASAEAGDTGTAIKYLQKTRGPELQQWFDIHAQNTGRFRVAHFGREPKPDPLPDLDPLRSVTSFERELFERDGYRCRYCDTTVFPTAMLNRFERMVGPEHFKATGTNATRHGVRMAFSAALDHVDPWSRGGRTDPTNLVTTCWPCNYGKAEYTLSELGIDDPRGIRLHE